MRNGAFEGQRLFSTIHTPPNQFCQRSDKWIWSRCCVAPTWPASRRAPGGECLQFLFPTTELSVTYPRCLFNSILFKAHPTRRGDPMSITEHFLQDTWKSFQLASEANGPKEIERYAEIVRRFTETSTIPLNANETITPCPKCGTDMALKAVLPHPIIAGLKRYAYVCAPCDRARTYMLPTR